MDRKYYSYPEDRLKEGKIRTVCLSSSEEVFKAIADEMTDQIKKNNAKGEKSVFIVPVGPVGQYPYFVDKVRKENIQLKNVWFINMDEYLNDDLSYISMDDRLSFRGFMERTVYSQLPESLNIPEHQRIFPDPARPQAVPQLIEELGKVDICFGGIGINGHLAFNEAEEVSAAEFAGRETRIIEISRETRVANAIGDLNGAIDAMPRYAVTVGMKEILSARKIRLGVFRSWHRAVIRQALFDGLRSTATVTRRSNSCRERLPRKMPAVLNTLSAQRVLRP